MDQLNSMNEVIYPEIEPGIINKQMIDKAYLESGGKGEKGRLHKLEEINYEHLLRIRLEFKNILRIDHLWTMPNLTKLSLNCNKIETIEHIEMLTALKELDLSFNYIERIERLDKLVNLEVLSLFNNFITKIENLDELENLIILSLGNNKIDSVRGIERFRFLPKLNVLNLEGNPIAKNTEFPLSTYIAAILPNVKYYEYVYIKDDIRNEAKEKFHRQLHEIEAAEEEEIEIRNKLKIEKLDEERLSSSFVEYLNELQLYESLWQGDEDGRVLLLAEGTDELTEEYRNDVFNVTQEIYKLGLEKFEERQQELNEFINGFEKGEKAIQESGQRIIDNYLQYKEEIFVNATSCLKALETRTMVGEDEGSPESMELIEQYEKLSTLFNDRTNKVWQLLMSEELHLYENTEETITNFQRIIQEMMSNFIEQAQSYFCQLREIAMHFSENLAVVVSRFVAFKLATKQIDDVPQDLKICLEDKDSVMNFIAGMKDYQTQRIDEREDRLVNRSREYIEELIGNLNRNELERNRAKILEINSFLELMSESLTGLQDEICEEVMNDYA